MADADVVAALVRAHGQGQESALRDIAEWLRLIRFSYLAEALENGEWHRDVERLRGGT